MVCGEEHGEPATGAHEGRTSPARPGPLFRLEQRLNLTSRDPIAITKRAVGAMSITWLPIVAIAGAQRVLTGAWDPLVTRSEIHVRLLVSLPLLLVGAASLEYRVRDAGQFLVEGDVLPAPARTGWLQWLDRLRVARDSAYPDLAIAAAVFAVGLASYLGFLPNGVLRWLAPSLHDVAPGWHGHSAAWWWYMLVGQPLFLFVLTRWLFRWGVWGATLWLLPRHGPHAQAAHADGVGGLGFLATPLFSYRFLAIAVAAALTAVWTDEIARGHAQPVRFASDFVGFICLNLVLAFAPYATITPLLIRTKHGYEKAYSILLRAYVDAFERKWLPVPDERRDRLLGAADIRSLADIGTSFTVVGTMRTTVPSREEVKAQMFAAVLPFSALFFLYVIPVTDLALQIFKRFTGE